MKGQRRKQASTALLLTAGALSIFAAPGAVADDTLLSSKHVLPADELNHQQTLDVETNDERLTRSSLRQLRRRRRRRRDGIVNTDTSSATNNNTPQQLAVFSNLVPSANTNFEEDSSSYNFEATIQSSQRLRRVNFLIQQGNAAILTVRARSSGGVFRASIPALAPGSYTWSVQTTFRRRGQAVEASSPTVFVVSNGTLRNTSTVLAVLGLFIYELYSPTHDFF